MCLCVGGGCYRRREDHLDDTRHVTQVEEDQAAMVAPSVDPSRKLDSLSRIGCCEHAAIHVSQGRPSSKGPLL